jgi:uncharacterized membrane protein YhaH (DUF805 family)
MRVSVSIVGYAQRRPYLNGATFDIIGNLAFFMFSVKFFGQIACKAKNKAFFQ